MPRSIPISKICSYEGWTRNGVTIFGSFTVLPMSGLRRHGHHAARADDGCAERGQPFFEELITTIDVLKAADLGRAFRGQRGQHERAACADIRRFNHGILEFRNTVHDCASTRNGNVRPHTRQFAHIDEAGVEDGLFDVRCPLRQREVCDHRRLQVGRKPRVRRGRDVGCCPGRTALHSHAHAFGLDLRARARQDVAHAGKHGRIEAGDGDVPARDRAGEQKRAGDQPVRDDGVLATVQLLHALDDDRLRPLAVDLGADGDEEIGDVDDLRLARRVLNGRGALGPHGRQHDVLGGADARFGERDRAGAQLRRSDDDRTMLEVDVRAERFKAVEMHVHRSRSQDAPAGHGDFRLTETAEQRTGHVERRVELADERVRRDV